MEGGGYFREQASSATCVRMSVSLAAVLIIIHDSYEFLIHTENKLDENILLSNIALLKRESTALPLLSRGEEQAEQDRG